jgi:phosphomannomutase
MAGIFKAYDIRGIHGEEMAETDAVLIGAAFCRVLADLIGKDPADLRIGLGRDMRLTAPAMASALTEGMLGEGAQVLDAGEIGTEMLYFLVGDHGLDGGAMVTASHNPSAYTGIKLVREGALALSGESGIEQIESLIDSGIVPGDPSLGSLSQVDIWEPFRRRVLEFIDKEAIEPLKVVVDGGNGMAGPMVGPILRELGLDLTELYFTPDGNFPDHEPNPLLEENRELISRTVAESGADLGIAWDGDADRCFFIDETGAFCDGDFLCALLARSLIEEHPGSTVIYDPRSSRAVRDTVFESGGKTALSRVGHAYFKKRMREEDAVFGGEVSGHYYFRDFFSADSGTIPALLMLEILSVGDSSLADLMESFRSRYFISGEINSEVTEPGRSIDRIREIYGDGDITELDGVSVDYPDWHFNVRASNTEPLLRLNLESLISPAHMEEKRDELLAVIRNG